MLDDLKHRGVKFTEAIDTQTPTGRAMWQMIGVLAELERKRTDPRRSEGRKKPAPEIRAQPKLTPQQIDHARKS